MKEQKLSIYMCELCNTSYKNKEKCRECEKGHKKAVEVVDQIFTSIINNNKGYPIGIRVKMADGEIVYYHR